MKVCLVPRVSGVGGMVSFRDRLVAVFERWGIEVTQDLRDTPYQAVLVIGGTRQLGELWRARRRGIPIVQRLDGLNWLHRLPPDIRPTSFSLRHRLRAELANLTLALIRQRLATAVVYQSHFARDWWERLYGPTRPPQRVIYNGVDLDHFTPDGEHQRPGERLRLLMVEGSLGGGYEWGLGVAVRLLEELRVLQRKWGKRYPQGLELMVVGQVAEEIRQSWDRKSGAGIRWQGRVAPTEIPFLDRSAHLLYSADIHPACPNAVIEALACGLPVLAFESGALPELVTQDCGRVVPYGGDAWRLQPPDIPALARAAVEIALQQEQMRPAARARAEACFDVQEMAKAYAEVLGIVFPSFTPDPSPAGRGEQTLTPDPSPGGRGGTDSLSLRERARVRDKSKNAEMSWQPEDALTPDPSPKGRGEQTLTPNPSPRGRGEKTLTPDPSPEGRGATDSLSHTVSRERGQNRLPSLWLVGLGMLSRLMPLAVKRQVYRLPWLAGWLRQRVNLSVGNGLQWVEITAGGLKGLSLYLDLSQEKDYWLGTYEPELQQAIQELVQPGQTAYDVGANVGYVSLLLARRVGRQGKVIAFEPFPANVQRLKQNLSANADLAQMEVVAAAVVETAQTVTFLVGVSDDTGRVVTGTTAVPSAGKQLAVQGVALDELVFEQGYPPPQVIKIDIEGGEVAALRGMRRLLQQMRPLVLLETHNQTCTETAWQLLTQAGYRLCWMKKDYPALNQPLNLPRRAYLVAFPPLQG